MFKRLLSVIIILCLISCMQTSGFAINQSGQACMNSSCMAPKSLLSGTGFKFTEFVGGVYYSIYYGIRIVAGIFLCKTDFGSMSADKEVIDYLKRFRPLYCSAISVLCSMIMEMDQNPVWPKHVKSMVILHSEKIFLLLDLVDDIVDEQGLSADEKVVFLMNIENCLLEGHSFKGQNLPQRAAIALAASIYNEVVKPDPEKSLFHVKKALVEAAIEQLKEKDPEKLRVLTEKVGGYSLESIIVPVEFISGKKFPFLRELSYRLGAVYHLWDNYYDRYVDLHFKTETFVTLFLNSEQISDSYQIKEIIKRSSADILGSVQEKLKGYHQRSIYLAAHTLLVVKYHLIDRIRKKINPGTMVRWRGVLTFSASRAA